VLKRGWRNQEVKEAMDLCLACKGCKSECPTNVDIATYKSEFLSHYYAGRLRPLNHYAFGFIDKWSQLASLAPKLVNAIGRMPPADRMAKGLLQIPEERSIPKLAEETFITWVRKQPIRAGSRGQIVLFADTFNNYFRSDTARAAWEVLQNAGFSIQVPQTKGHLCCGRPLYDFGLLAAARKYLQRVLVVLEPYVNAGLPIILLEPSCASVFRDELRGLFPHDAVAHRLRQQTFTFSGFLQSKVPGYLPPRLPGRKVLLHGHCHHKAVLKFSDEEALLKRMEVQLQSLDSGCCGMAGPFGFEKTKINVSQALGERVLLPAVRAADPDTIVVTNGFSCREQIGQNTGRETLHVAELIRMAMAATNGASETRTKKR
jgi:Fe-S oxidoreductase